ncbi:MAG: shikimate dehydrogenase [Ilumatobacteraceae bacterium]
MSTHAGTIVAAVIGSPVRHSLSPIIHNAAFRHHGDDWVYVAFDIGDTDARVAVDAARVLGVGALSVTMPYKERVIDALDEVTSGAIAVRSVNTIVRRDDGTLLGATTDGEGCVAALLRHGAVLDHVVVVGAGATARAVIAACVGHGARVTCINRSPQRAADAVAVGESIASGSTRHGAVGDIARASVLVNTTPLGMTGVAPDELPVPRESLHAGLVVLDAVYHPLETPLLRAAREIGARAVDGLEMLVAQAVLQQALWLGRRPDHDVMRTAALDELDRRHR